jgi:hypothetical protein
MKLPATDIRITIRQSVSKLPQVGLLQLSNQVGFVRTAAIMNGIEMSGACGTGWNEPWVRDSWGNANFTGSCRTHDRCYETCGRSKEDCDRTFHSDLRSACRRAYTSYWHRPYLRACLEMANTYHSAVDRMGGDAYRAAQRASNC